MVLLKAIVFFLLFLTQSTLLCQPQDKEERTNAFPKAAEKQSEGFEAVADPEEELRKLEAQQKKNVEDIKNLNARSWYVQTRDRQETTIQIEELALGFEGSSSRFTVWELADESKSRELIMDEDKRDPSLFKVAFSMIHTPKTKILASKYDGHRYRRVETLDRKNDVQTFTGLHFLYGYRRSIDSQVTCFREAVSGGNEYSADIKRKGAILAISLWPSNSNKKRGQSWFFDTGRESMLVRHNDGRFGYVDTTNIELQFVDEHWLPKKRIFTRTNSTSEDGNVFRRQEYFDMKIVEPENVDPERFSKKSFTRSKAKPN